MKVSLANFFCQMPRFCRWLSRHARALEDLNSVVAEVDDVNEAFGGIGDATGSVELAGILSRSSELLDEDAGTGENLKWRESRQKRAKLTELKTETGNTWRHEKKSYG